MSQENNGHRARLRERMLKDGLSSFQDHEILEMLLFQYNQRKDTNKLAHRLLNSFGSFAGVLNASPAQLMTVEGVGEVTACNLAILKEVWLRYKRSDAMKKQRLIGLQSMVEYAQELLVDCYSERMIVIYVDEGTNFVFSQEFDSNDNEYVQVEVKTIVATALRVGASGVLLFHCHIKGKCQPSNADLQFTEKLFVGLASVNLVLLEHMIFNANGEYHSFYAAGEMSRLQEKYKISQN